MKSIINRCQNCHQTYTYFLSGNYIPPFNNRNYCPECFEVIVKALEKERGPKVRHKRVAEIYHGISKELVSQIDGFIKEYQKAINCMILPCPVIHYIGLPDITDAYNIFKVVIDGYTYYRATRRDNLRDIRYFVDVEKVFDCPVSDNVPVKEFDELYQDINNWKTIGMWQDYSNNRKNGAVTECRIPRTFVPAENVPVKPLTKPECKLTYFDIK